MTNLMRFNRDGLRAFTHRLASMKEHPGGALDDIMFSARHTEVVSNAGDVPVVAFTSRLEAAEAVELVLTGCRVDVTQARRDPGLWAWLSARWIDSLAPLQGDGLRKTGATWRWVPDLHSHQTYYRHLLLGPYSIYAMYKADPAAALCVLGGPAATPGELVEQLASRVDVITNRNLVAAATQLYWDPEHNRPKAGAAGKDAGSVRRLVDVFGQFDRTYDFRETSVDRILELLPSEFDRFKPVSA